MPEIAQVQKNTWEYREGVVLFLLLRDIELAKDQLPSCGVFSFTETEEIALRELEERKLSGIPLPSRDIFNSQTESQQTYVNHQLIVLYKYTLNSIPDA